MDIAGLLFLWCVDLTIPGLEMFCLIMMSMRCRRFALAGALGVALSTGVTKILALQGVLVWIEYLPGVVLWLRRASAVLFLGFALLLFKQFLNVQGGMRSQLFQWKKVSFWRGIGVGGVVAILNPADIVGTLAMLGCFAERGMGMDLCLKVVAFMVLTGFLWSLFLIFVASTHKHWVEKKSVQKWAFAIGACVFCVYAVHSVRLC